MRIPKVIHRVWLKGFGGDDDPPAIVNGWWDKWKQLYPGWEFKTWDGSEFEIEHREYFDVSPCFAWKSDLFRYQVLQRFGGLYVDCDVEPYRNMEDVIAPHQCFFSNQIGGVSNALMGSIPGHSVWTRIFAKLKAKPPQWYHRQIGGATMDKVPRLSGPIFLRPTVTNINDVSILDGTVMMTAEHDKGKHPGVYNHHHMMNNWRSPGAVKFYREEAARNAGIHPKLLITRVGNILESWFQRLGVPEDAQCSGCKNLKQEMNNKGPDWCERTVDRSVKLIMRSVAKMKASGHALPRAAVLLTPALVKATILRAVKVSRARTAAKTLALGPNSIL